jgi:hypothetical protein
MNVSEALARARSMIGKGITYKLGRGGMNPAAPTPADKAGRCDCSGFVCWCLGLSRQNYNPVFRSNWISTASIVADANGPAALFSRLQDPVPGAIWVYPPSAAKRYGHVAIIETVNPFGCTIVHCRSVKAGDAVATTSAALFENNPTAVIAWYAGLVSPMDVFFNELLLEA